MGFPVYFAIEFSFSVEPLRTATSVFPKKHLGWSLGFELQASNLAEQFYVKNISRLR